MAEYKVQVLPDPDAVAQEAAERIVRAANEAIALHDRFSIALSGGSTPEKLYKLLAADPYRSKLEWPKIEIFFGDERTVPPDHPDSNFRMANAALLSKVPLLEDHIHRMRGEINPEEAAKEYGQLLKKEFGDGGVDMVLLGMGDDGHTASLFPNTTALEEPKHRCVANYVEKFKTWRITMTAPFINRSRDICIMVAGANKASRVQEVLEGPRDPKRLPIQMIDPAQGRLIWLLDAGAAGMSQ